MLGLETIVLFCLAKLHLFISKKGVPEFSSLFGSTMNQLSASIKPFENVSLFYTLYDLLLLTIVPTWKERWR